jgi:ATP-binding cassette subfamily B protein
MGPVGCGKSTLISVLTGAIKCDSGSININTVDVDYIKRKELLSKIGYVPQDPLLFSGSIFDNVHFGVSEKNKQLFETVLDVSQLRKEIESFPLKEKTILGERGTAVSGGQKQRIAIARALMRNPEYLILDDITSSLDAENEKQLWVDMAQHFPNTGALMVSHRISTVSYADVIVYINDKHELFKGTHEELFSNNIEYRDFIQTQIMEREEVV